MEANRFDGMNHWPEHDEKYSRSVCKWSGCNQRTHVFCTKCKVSLCFNKNRNCFRHFHTHSLVLPQSNEATPKSNNTNSTEGSRHRDEWKDSAYSPRRSPRNLVTATGTSTRSPSGRTNGATQNAGPTLRNTTRSEKIKFINMLELREKKK